MNPILIIQIQMLIFETSYWQIKRNSIDESRKLSSKTIKIYLDENNTKIHAKKITMNFDGTIIKGAIGRLD